MKSSLRSVLLSAACLLAAASHAFATPVYYADVAVGPGTPASQGPTPQSVTESGPGYGYSGATWTTSAWADPGLTGVAINGSGNPNPFNQSSAVAKAQTYAVFSDTGGASQIAVSFNALLDGYKNWTGQYESDLNVSIVVGSSLFTGAIRNNHAVQPHALGLFAGHVGQTFDHVMLVTGSVLVPVGIPVMLQIYLATTDTMSNGAHSSIDAAYTLGLAAGGHVFNLPDTATVQIADWGVIDNLAPGGVTVPGVPEGPVSASLVLSAVLLLHAVRRRMGSAAAARG